MSKSKCCAYYSLFFQIFGMKNQNEIFNCLLLEISLLTNSFDQTFSLSLFRRPSVLTDLQVKIHESKSKDPYSVGHFLHLLLNESLLMWKNLQFNLPIKHFNYTNKFQYQTTQQNQTGKKTDTSTFYSGLKSMEIRQFQSSFPMQLLDACVSIFISFFICFKSEICSLPGFTKSKKIYIFAQDLNNDTKLLQLRCLEVINFILLLNLDVFVVIYNNLTNLMGVVTKLFVVFALLAVANMISLKVNHQFIQPGIYTIHPFISPYQPITLQNGGLSLNNYQNSPNQKFNVNKQEQFYEISTFLNLQFFTVEGNQLKLASPNGSDDQLFQITQMGRGYAIKPKTNLDLAFTYSNPQSALTNSYGSLKLERFSYSPAQTWSFSRSR